MGTLGVTRDSVDLFLDYADESGTFVTSVLGGALRDPALTAGWRSLTVGGSAWPKDLPTGRGVFELPRTDWVEYRDTYRALSGGSWRLPDFFDYAVANPDPSLDVDPKLLTISATFRYAVDEQWRFTRGALFKASGGRGLGGAAVPSALLPLVGHPLFETPIRTDADTWIRAAAAGGKSGNPMTWRQWATFRHVLVTQHQLANSLAP